MRHSLALMQAPATLNRSYRSSRRCCMSSSVSKPSVNRASLARQLFTLGQGLLKQSFLLLDLAPKIQSEGIETPQSSETSRKGGRERPELSSRSRHRRGSSSTLRVGARAAPRGAQRWTRGAQEPRRGPRELRSPWALQEPRRPHGPLRALGSPGCARCALRALGLREPEEPGWVEQGVMGPSGDASQSGLWDWGAMRLTPMHLGEVVAAWWRARGSVRKSLAEPGSEPADVVAAPGKMCFWIACRACEP